MLQSKIGHCNDCAHIDDLISSIDKKLLYYGKNKLNNIKYLASLDYNKENIGLLIKYKYILNHKLFNPSYCCEINLASIISRVKVLLNK